MNGIDSNAWIEHCYVTQTEKFDFNLTHYWMEILIQKNQIIAENYIGHLKLKASSFELWGFVLECNRNSIR